MADKSKTIVVVGGVAGGAGAAVKARRVDESANIIMFERGPYVSYANCGIPYYVGGDIADRDELLLITPERFKERFNIDVYTNAEVIKIDRESKEVEVFESHTGQKRRQHYDKLIIATGSRPGSLNIPGIRSSNIFTLWTVPDAIAIKQWVQRTSAKSALVIGGGFVGLEAVEAFVNLGLRVVLVEASEQLMPAFDREMVSPVLEHLKRHRVYVKTGAAVTAFKGEPAEEAVLSDGSSVSFDIAVVSAGVKPNLELAVDSGLAMGKAGGLSVNEYMQTSDPDIYAAGDIAESINMITGEQSRIPLAGPANKQARVAGANAAGGSLSYNGALGSMIIKVLDYTLAKAGLSEKEANSIGIDHFVSYTHSSDHAGYYPGSTIMAIKLTVERNSGRVLGAQIVGQNGVDKRIDILATAMYAGMTVWDLEQLDLAYAPPFSSAKDPVNIAGMVASNIMRGEVVSYTPAEVKDMLNLGDEVQIVDVRTPREYNAGHLPGAVNIPVDELRARYRELDLSKKTVLYCGIAYRSYLGLRMLDDKGFRDIGHMSGGYNAWILL